MKYKIVLLSLCCLLLMGQSCRRDKDLDVSTLKELEQKLETQYEDNRLTAVSYALVKNGDLLYSGAQGLADETNNIAATANTRYLIASVSKTVTAVAMLTLVDQQRIGLDDDINLYLPFPVRNPSYPNDKLTPRMLLTHTSSISDDFQNTLDLYCYGTDCAMTLDQFFNAVFVSSGQYYSANNFSNAQPGTAEDYSNLASALVGYIVERVSQTPFDAYCEANIFAPLGMTKTEWRLANTPRAELAIPYSNDITNPDPHYTFPDYPNGGLRTTVLDMSNFLRMLIQNGTFNGTQILSPASVAEMRTLQFGSTEQCLSLYYTQVYDRNLLGHNGGEKGVTTEMQFDPETGVGVVVFNNDDDAPLDGIISLLMSYGEKQ